MTVSTIGAAGLLSLVLNQEWISPASTGRCAPHEQRRESQMTSPAEQRFHSRKERRAVRRTNPSAALDDRIACKRAARLHDMGGARHDPDSRAFRHCRDWTISTPSTATTRGVCVCPHSTRLAEPMPFMRGRIATSASRAARPDVTSSNRYSRSPPAGLPWHANTSPSHRVSVAGRLLIHVQWSCVRRRGPVRRRRLRYHPAIDAHDCRRWSNSRTASGPRRCRRDRTGQIQGLPD